VTTFAEEVHREVFGAPLGSYRWLDGSRWRKAVVGGRDLWVEDGSGRTLTDLAMWEATVHA
jgi:hypothetical protein